MKTIKSLLIAGSMLFAAAQASAQIDSTHMTRSQLLASWGNCNRLVPPHPIDSATWYSVWNFATDGYPGKTYVQNGVNPIISTKIVVLDTAQVNTSGYAQFNLRQSISGTLKAIFTKSILSLQFTAENDTITTAQNAPFCSIIMDSAYTGKVNSYVRVRVTVGTTNPSTGPTAKKAPAGTIVYGRFEGQ